MSWAAQLARYAATVSESVDKSGVPCAPAHLLHAARYARRVDGGLRCGEHGLCGGVDRGRRGGRQTAAMMTAMAMPGSNVPICYPV